ncbi:MAG: hypothetical protein H0V29_08785 [Thermoleophilaceae bacterium]|nr:hypothetical protein [Thermoleophilaceae bacterium]
MAAIADELSGSRRRLELLAQASAVLAESLDYEATLRNVVRLAVPDVADWVSVDLIGEVGPCAASPGTTATR